MDVSGLLQSIGSNGWTIGGSVLMSWIKNMNLCWPKQPVEVYYAASPGLSSTIRESGTLLRRHAPSQWLLKELDESPPFSRVLLGCLVSYSPPPIVSIEGSTCSIC